jgi:hypothetical protein
MKKFSTPPLRRPPKETMNKEKATNEFHSSRPTKKKKRMNIKNSKSLKEKESN